MKATERESGIMYAVAGASQHGKSTWVKTKTKKAKRLIVRDPRGEYVQENCTMVKTIRDLARALQAAGDGPARLSYFGSDRDAEAWCELAYTWGQLWPVVIINEEVASVTNAGKASGAWGDLCRMGLYYGNHIYGVTQRPQECDKTLWGNATCVHSHSFVLPNDIRYMSRVLGVDESVIKELPRYAWLERWQGETEIRRSKPG